MLKRFQIALCLIVVASCGLVLHGDEPKLSQSRWGKLAKFSQPSSDWEGKFGDYRSPLSFEDGTRVQSVADWTRRRQEIQK